MKQTVRVGLSDGLPTRTDRPRRILLARIRPEASQRGRRTPWACQDYLASLFDGDRAACDVCDPNPGQRPGLEARPDR